MTNAISNNIVNFKNRQIGFRAENQQGNVIPMMDYNEGQPVMMTEPMMYDTYTQAMPFQVYSSSGKRYHHRLIF